MGATVSYAIGRLLDAQGKDQGPFSFSIYHAGADAVNAIQKVSRSTTATATSNQSFSLPEGQNVLITDFIAGPATGVLGISKDGLLSAARVILPAQQAAIVRTPLNILLAGGHEYGVEVTATLAA